jgi:hypothetical protein
MLMAKPVAAPHHLKPCRAWKQSKRNYRKQRGWMHGSAVRFERKSLRSHKSAVVVSGRSRYRFSAAFLSSGECSLIRENFLAGYPCLPLDVWALALSCLYDFACRRADHLFVLVICRASINRLAATRRPAASDAPSFRKDTREQYTRGCAHRGLPNFSYNSIRHCLYCFRRAISPSVQTSADKSSFVRPC